MMKKVLTAVLALMLLLALTACGGNSAETESSAVADVDLQSFYSELEKTYQWGENYMVDVEGEMLESYYPGLGELDFKQLIAKMPNMSSVVNEMVFLQCETEDEAAQAAAILQNRIDTQAQGGAWYPESMEAWGRGIVIQQGTYVGMIASAEHQDEISEKFNSLFL